MTDIMKSALAAEIDTIRSWIAYEDSEYLMEITTLEEAQLQIECMTTGRDPDEPLPAGLLDPATMMTVWNHCIAAERQWAEDRKKEYELRYCCDNKR